MRILDMQAAYGRLRGDTLRLEPGLNVICAPNESGKSTWCSFLRTMHIFMCSRLVLCSFIV